MMVKIKAFLILIIFLSIAVTGCITHQYESKGSLEHTAGVRMVGEKEVVPQVQIREFSLSPGDEISITVLDHNEMSRRLIIPPDGRFFYPLIGEIDIKDKTIRQLRETIRNGLSNYQELKLNPGDEIAITVYRNDELNRKLIIHPDNLFFYPLVGEIDTRNKTPAQIRGVITTKLSKYIVDPQVSVDIIAYNRPKIIIDPQVSVEVVALSGQKIFVLGEVNRPGVFIADSGIDLIEAISRAGGFTLEGRPENVMLIRGGMERPELVLLNIDEFFNGTDLTQNVPLQKGDIIYVPASTIANVDRFFKHLAAIINPIVTLETGIVLVPAVEDTFSGSRNRSNPTVIVPPR